MTNAACKGGTSDCGPDLPLATREAAANAAPQETTAATVAPKRTVDISQTGHASGYRHANGDSDHHAHGDGPPPRGQLCDDHHARLTTTATLTLNGDSATHHHANGDS